MTVIRTFAPRSGGDDVPPLEPGDHLDQKTFHKRYEQYPEDVKFELIGGIVYMASPLKADHGDLHVLMTIWLGNYMASTPGVVASDNSTTILGEFSEPQPDLSLRVLRECGGSSRVDDDGYLSGPPELIVEVASSSASYDLHAKRRDYEAAGVREYVVVVVRDQRVAWLTRRDGSFAELAPGPDGVLRSEFFGGLWLDPAALFRRDSARLLAVLQQGLTSPDHAAAVQRFRPPA
jgi:Uma2 family endonuclease